MKKVIVFLTLSVIILSVSFTGCSSSSDDSKTTGDTGTGTENSSSTPAPTATPDNNGDKEIKTDTGRYTGQIDGNSIEIKISGVPDDLAAKAFRFDENTGAKTQFEQLGLTGGENVKFRYWVNEHGQNLIIEIEKI